eukprot:12409684-Karenia_brevis.AAC.1
MDPNQLEAAMAGAEVHYNEMESAAPWGTRESRPGAKPSAKPRPSRKNTRKGKGSDDVKDIQHSNKRRWWKGCECSRN